MAATHDPRSESSQEGTAVARETASPAAAGGTGLASGQPPDRTQQHAQVLHPSPDAAAQPSDAAPSARPWRKRLLVLLVLGGLGYGVYALVPTVETALNTISTDDAYVNGHVTFLAPRVAGQVSRVFVDDNYRVQKGKVLVQLDKEPYQVQLAIKQAAVTAAEADLTAARAQVYGVVGQMRAARFALERAVEELNTKVAQLGAAVATLKSNMAKLDLARANLKRGEELLPSGGVSKEDLDVRRQSAKVAEADVDQARQTVYADRVGLGLSREPPAGQDLAYTPVDLIENFSAVRQALGQLLQIASQIGYTPATIEATPRQAMEAFLKQDPEGNIEHIYAKLIPQAPGIKQAEAKLLQ
ncbi:MAG TPA: biotin/lipoyl-binding protein, partial [Isosphaeraceae bacterium]|nr:biotin/lipoyl-binding protein [Isosphaeraceae bacterium]